MKNSDLDAELYPCKKCGTKTILMFMLCADCRKTEFYPMMSKEEHSRVYKLKKASEVILRRVNDER